MFIRLVDLPAKGHTFQLTWNGRSLTLAPGRTVTLDALSAEVEAIPEGSHHRVHGHAAYSATAFCDRCLESMKLEGDVAISVVCKVRSAARQFPHERPMPVDEVDDWMYEGDGVELADVLEEAVRLEFPPRFVCNEECRGLCPNCGVNRNRESCSCAAVAVDHSLSGLAVLLKERKEGE